MKPRLSPVEVLCECNSQQPAAGENTDIAQLKLAKVIKEETALLMRLREVILNTTLPAIFPVRVLLRLSLFWGGAEKKPIHSNQTLM